MNKNGATVTSGKIALTIDLSSDGIAKILNVRNLGINSLSTNIHIFNVSLYAKWFCIDKNPIDISMQQCTIHNKFWLKVFKMVKQAHIIDFFTKFH